MNHGGGRGSHKGLGVFEVKEGSYLLQPFLWSLFCGRIFRVQRAGFAGGVLRVQTEDRARECRSRDRVVGSHLF